MYLVEQLYIVQLQINLIKVIIPGHCIANKLLLIFQKKSKLYMKGAILDRKHFILYIEIQVYKI